jgi:serine-threonine kinase receptor-associated protein
MAAALQELLSEHSSKGPPPIVCPGHTRPLAEVSFSPETPDGYFLVSACLDGQPMLRDATTGDWIGTFAGHKGAVWSAKLCSEARLCATGSGDFSAKVWDAVTGNCLATLDHRHVVKCVDFSSDRRLLATVGKEGAARVFDVEAGLGASGPERLFGARDDSDGRKVTVNKCAWTEAGLLVCGAADGKVSVLDPRVDGDDPIAIIDVGKDAVMDLELTNGALGPTLTVCSGEQVHLVDAVRWTSTKKVIDCPVHFREEGGASLRSDGKEIVVGGGRHGGSRQGALGVEKGAKKVGDVGSDLCVHVIDVKTGKVSLERKGHCGPVRCVRFHPDAKAGRFATGSEDGTIRLWDPAEA